MHNPVPDPGWEEEMADEAIRVLQQAIDTARSEGFAEGFGVAMRMVQEFSGSALAPEGPKSRPTAKVRARPGSLPSTPKGRVRLSDVPYVARVPGGVADTLVERAYQSISPRAAGPTEIQYLVKNAGSDLPETSVRRAIDRLESRNKIRRIPGTTTWVYGSGEMDDDSKGNESTASGSGLPNNSGNAAAPLSP